MHIFGQKHGRNDEKPLILGLVFGSVSLFGLIFGFVFGFQQIFSLIFGFGLILGLLCFILLQEKHWQPDADLDADDYSILPVDLV